MNNKNLECLDCKCKLGDESAGDSFLECPECHKVYQYNGNNNLEETKLYNFDKFKCPKCEEYLVDSMFEYGICSSCGSIYTDIKDLK